MAIKYIKPGSGTGSGTLSAPYFYDNELATAEAAAGSGGTLYFTDGAYDFTGDVTWDENGVTYESLNLQKAVLTRTGLNAGDAPNFLNVGASGNTIAPNVKNFKIVNFMIKFSHPTGLSTANNPTFQGNHVSTSTRLSMANANRAILATPGLGQPIKVYDNSFSWEYDGAYGRWLRRIATGSDFQRNSFFLEVTNLTTIEPDGNNIISINKNNIFATTDNAKANTSPNVSTNSVNCCIHNFSVSSGGTDNIFADPLYVYPENGDLRLRPSSPCIGTATTS